MQNVKRYPVLNWMFLLYYKDSLPTYLSFCFCYIVRRDVRIYDFVNLIYYIHIIYILVHNEKFLVYFIIHIFIMSKWKSKSEFMYIQEMKIILVFSLFSSTFRPNTPKESNFFILWHRFLS